MSPPIVIVLILSVLTTVLLTLWSGWSLTALGMMVVILASLGYLAVQVESNRVQTEQLRRLQAAYDQLDQQAKLIIRTDMELHRTQEELDRRLASLMSLHELGQHLEVSLRPEEVFEKLSASIVSHLGFSKGLLGMCPSPDRLEWRSLMGASAEEAERLRTRLTGSPLLTQILQRPSPELFNATSTSDPLRRTLLELLGVQTLVIAGIAPHAGPSGCLILGRAGTGLGGLKADEELVAILVKQLATAVENSVLFEQTWTAQQRLEHQVHQRTQELAEANAKLIQLNNAKSDFVSAVSHELRTPLAAIKGYAALLTAGQFGDLAPAQRERLAKIEKHSDALTQFINNLLDIARIESGRTTMEGQVIQVEEFLETIHELLQPQLKEKHLRYEVDHDGITQLCGDAQQLQRVFVNLLSNAIKYTPERGTIRVGFRRDGHSILATVSDSGCGIPPEDLPKLFQEFYRSKDPVNQQVRGTGLGLALVKRIVEAHQGAITVTSEQGTGSQFTVRLPATGPSSPPPAAG